MQKIKYIFFFLFNVSSILFSQTVSSSQNATASAYLVVPISITATSGDLDFGSVLLTGTSTKITIAPSEGKLFVVSGHPNKDVTINFENVPMDNAGWAATTSGVVDNLTFVPKVQLEDGSSIKNGKSKPLVLDGSVGKLNIWVGGSIKIGANQEVGDYTGLFTLNVNY
ncbi:MAG: DUF4402 domain-containing protein [Melioribacteraceae bacterium]|jgi:hypothetical protein|nr:DUF4402 domain-containing protein [Melioribacteraceae bacterium]